MNKPLKPLWSTPTLERIALTEDVLALYRSRARTSDELAKLEALVRRAGLRRAS